VRELDLALRADSALAARVFETHPEVALTVLTGKPLMASKKTAEGQRQRRAFLAGQSVDLPDPLPRIEGAAADDIIDAAICLVVARRIAKGVAQPFPPQPERDAFGIAIAIWA
jgi:predicted RNase H-like nuclease